MERAEKLFLGGRLKRLRRDLALNQSQMAKDLGVSPSYLNHLERNQRPLTAQILLKLAGVYDLDIRAFVDTPQGGGQADLAEVLADPMFKDLAIPRHEISALIDHAPGAAEAMTRLYTAFSDRRRREEMAGGPADPADPSRLGGEVSSPAWVRDYIQAHNNHFPDLDIAGETLARQVSASPHDFEAGARERLQSRHGIRVQVLEPDIMRDSIRRYDPHSRRLFLAEAMGAASRAFALAYHLALFEAADDLNGLVEAAGAPDMATRRLLKISLANYLAAAILMPYEAFHAAAEASGYDIARLKAAFGASFEQICHRLTTLSRANHRGVPFFLLRVDAAGNVSKRFASGAFPFSRFGGTCPRWNIHTAFKTPRRIIRQIVETRDGARYFTLSRTVRRVAASDDAPDDGELAIGLGCELKHARRLVYARGLNLDEPAVTEIGPACQLCDRPACRERAAPPLDRTLMMEEWRRSVSSFPFAAHG
jgi:XRE family transcriptional regulator, fatty acid utilization regulator